MKNLLFIAVVALLLNIGLNASARAENEITAGKKNIASKEIQGIVSGIGYGSISIVYKSDAQAGTAEEILLPLDELEEIIHKQNIKQINVGDTVSVQYNETTQETEKGPTLLRKAKVINFIKPAAPIPAETDVLEEETSSTKVLN
ncbi:MAG: hypothetical protein KKD05_05965 [Candidatus Omnitrophica bacterium]|nr:hypothetical protein [Candidatus Omnitrophota bacterium]